MKNPIKNNIIIELHVPDFEVVKNFYSKLGFEMSIEDKPSESKSGY
jgi:predicted lactoylglutathione lyase